MKIRYGVVFSLVTVLNLDQTVKVGININEIYRRFLRQVDIICQDRAERADVVQTAGVRLRRAA